MTWYIYILKVYHSLSPSLGFESTDPRPTSSKWLLLFWYEGYQGLHNGVGSHCLAQPSTLVEFKPITFESHCANIPIWKLKNTIMKSKNLAMVFSSGVYLVGNSGNACKIVYRAPPPPPTLTPSFCWGSSFCIKNKLKSEIFKYKKIL